MADSAGKRNREAKKRLKREIKAERKRLRKEGLLGVDVEAPAVATENAAEPIAPPDESTDVLKRPLY